MDAEKVKREEQAYKPIPVITDFTDADGNDRMKEMIQENYNRIRARCGRLSPTSCSASSPTPNCNTCCRTNRYAIGEKRKSVARFNSRPGYGFSFSCIFFSALSSLLRVEMTRVIR